MSIIQNQTDYIACITQKVIKICEDALMNKRLVKTLDFSEVDDLLKILNMINTIVESFNKSQTLDNKVYHINKLYEIIYAE